MVVFLWFVKMWLFKNLKSFIKLEEVIFMLKILVGFVFVIYDECFYYLNN